MKYQREYQVSDIWIVHGAEHGEVPLTKCHARISEDGYAETTDGSQYGPKEYELTPERAIERCQADIAKQIAKLERRLGRLRSIKVTAEE